MKNRCKPCAIIVLFASFATSASAQVLTGGAAAIRPGSMSSQTAKGTDSGGYHGLGPTLACRVGNTTVEAALRNGEWQNALTTVGKVQCALKPDAEPKAATQFKDIALSSASVSDGYLKTKSLGKWKIVFNSKFDTVSIRVTDEIESGLRAFLKGP